MPWLRLVDEVRTQISYDSSIKYVFEHLDLSYDKRDVYRQIKQVSKLVG
jgi:hypothetical protein